MTVIDGSGVRLRTVEFDDVEALVTIRSAPEVALRWGAEDIRSDIAETVKGDDVDAFVIEDGNEQIVGFLQWHEETDPEYRHAGMDIYVDPAHHGRGIGSEAVRAAAKHLIEVKGHHRITIDPAADNVAAIRCYAKVGFKPVGVMRQYERIDGGDWHDGLMMDLLAEEFIG